MITNDFDPLDFAIVVPRTFEELIVGEVFRAPSRTLTDAHASAFQAVSADNHPVHYDAIWVKTHGHSAPVVHGLQVLAFTAPGTTLFPHVIDEVFIAFTGLSAKLLGEAHAGDTLYSELSITSLTPEGPNSIVSAAATVHNQRSEVVLSGEHTYLLRRTPASVRTSPPRVRAPHHRSKERKKPCPHNPPSSSSTAHSPMPPAGRLSPWSC